MYANGNAVNTFPDFESGVLERFNTLLQGRKPHPFGASVHLSRGIVTRLMRGSLPDPELLGPMVRIERLSLSWLLTGEGSPYSVNHYVGDVEAWQDLKAKLSDEPDAWQIYLAVSPAGWTVVLDQECSTTMKGGKEYWYRATEVTGGKVCGPVVARGIEHWSRLKKIQVLKLSSAHWIKLVTGHLGNAQLWGLAGVTAVADPQPLEDLATVLPSYSTPGEGRGGREDGRECTTDEEGALLRAFRSLTADEQGLVLRMIAAFASQP
ncbi:putative transposon-related DNA-binding protein [Microcystis phage vB_MaeS-yong1]|nr:putative transposon-related DNA-binding protein [Microcystis phage vB_MaeS-yong1]